MRAVMGLAVAAWFGLGCASLMAQEAQLPANIPAPKVTELTPPIVSAPSTCGSCANSATSTSCGTCETHGSKHPGMVKFVNWLTYKPLLTKCNPNPIGGCHNCRPPVWTFFVDGPSRNTMPCGLDHMGGKTGCGRCGAHGSKCSSAGCATCASKPIATTTSEPGVVQFQKPANANSVEPVTQAGHQTSQDNPPAGAKKPVIRPSTFDPTTIAPRMPVLPPSDFRRPTSPSPAPAAPPSAPR